MAVVADPRARPDFARPENNRFPGYRLGYPQAGPGSIAGVPRRIAALFLDYFMALGASLLFDRHQLAILACFVVLTGLGIALLGGSLGHLLLGMRVTRLDGGAPGPWRPFLRQLLLVIVLPAIVWDTDRRGGHDIAAGLALRLR